MSGCHESWVKLEEAEWLQDIYQRDETDPGGYFRGLGTERPY